MSTTARRDVFQAIADPTRRQIIQMISKQSMNLNAIAGNFEMSRPAISQQIKILEECGLVNIRSQGRERICEARLEALSEVNNWVIEYRRFWDSQFDSLGKYLDKIQKDKRKKHKK